MVESVDTRDLKSLGHYGCAGSSPASSTEEYPSNRQVGRVYFFVLLIAHRQADACSGVRGINVISFQSFSSFSAFWETGVQIIHSAAFGAFGFAVGIDIQSSDTQFFSFYRASAVISDVCTVDPHAQYGLPKDEATISEKDSQFAIFVSGLARILHHICRAVLGDGKKLSGCGDETVRGLLQAACEAYFCAGKVIVSLFARGERDR